MNYNFKEIQKNPSEHLVTEYNGIDNPPLISESSMSENISPEENLKKLMENSHFDPKLIGDNFKKSSFSLEDLEIIDENSQNEPISDLFQQVETKKTLQKSLRSHPCIGSVVEKNKKIKNITSQPCINNLSSNSFLNQINKNQTIKKNKFGSFPSPSINEEMSRESISSFIRSSKQNSLNTLLLKKKLKFSKTNPKKSLFNRESVLKKVEKTHKTAFYHVISNLYIVKKFISIMKNLTSFRKPKWLKKLHFTIINDLSFDYETFQQFSNETKNEKIKKLPSKNIFLSFFFNLSGKAIKILPIFDPTKKISIVWDSINILVMCFYFVVIPLDISFDEFDDIALIITIKMIFLLILFFDIFKSCFSSYYYKGVLVKDRRTILSHYFKSKFCIDCLTIIPLIFNQILLEIMFENDYWYFKVLQLVFFFKAGRFTYTLKKLVELVFIDSTIQNIISLIKLIIRIVLLAHILACIWFLIGKNQLYPEKNWISAYNLKDSEWSLQYLYAYYFVCVTMNTVGFGDITPQNPLEEVFVIIFIFVGCGIFAYSLNSIGIIVGDIWKRENEFTKDMSQINRFMKEKNINFELKMRVRKYLEYIWKEEKLEEMEEQVKIINKLSDSLKEELLLEANGPVIREIKLFSLNFSEETLRRMISKMKEIRFTPGDIIFTKNELTNSLYILRRGEVELFIDRSHSSNEPTLLKKLQPGEIFGELSFFTNNNRITSARSTDFTNVFMIDQEDFLEILRKNQPDFQRFCDIKDNINVLKNYEDLFLRCFSCKSSSHQLNFCPLLHYIPKKDIIIQKYKYSTPQIRVIKDKKRNKKYNSLGNLANIEKAAYKFQDEIFPRHETSSSQTSEQNEESVGDLFDSSLIQFENTLKEINEQSKENLEYRSSENIEYNNYNEGYSNNNINNEKEENIDNLNIDNIIGKTLFKRRRSKKKQIWIKQNSKKIFSNQLSVSSPKENNEKKLNLYTSFENLAEKENKSQNKSHNSTKNNTLLSTICHRKDDIDKVKSFDNYFPHNNIETLIYKIERRKFIKLNKKIKKSNVMKYKYQAFLQNSLDINQIVPVFLRGSTLYDKTKMMHRKLNLQRNETFLEKNNENDGKFNKKYYFKSSMNLEKLIAQENFDPEEIKEHFRKRYFKSLKTTIIIKFIKNCFSFLRKIIKCPKCAKRK